MYDADDVRCYYNNDDHGGRRWFLVLTIKLDGVDGETKIEPIIAISQLMDGK